jgi:hypothetical protein
MDVRAEQDGFHFCLGEMVPGEGGKPDFIPAFRCVLPADDAVNFFSYLRDKAVDARHAAERESRVSQTASSQEKDSPSRTDHSLSKVIRKRRITVSKGEPHAK